MQSENELTNLHCLGNDIQTKTLLHVVNMIEEQSQAIVESCFCVSNNKSRFRVVLHLLVRAGLI